MLTAVQLAFIDGMSFDPFFRGFLSVLVGVIVLIGGTYLIVATNTGARTGFFIAMTALFGWMFLMGIIWTVYGIGWRGQPPTWHLVEINVDQPDVADDGLAFSEVEDARVLAGVDLGAEGIDDVDEAQAVALENSRQQDLGEWRYLTASDGNRGEAQATADAFLIEDAVFESSADYVNLQFGAFMKDGKPVLKDNPNMVDRVAHFFNETFLHPFWGEELVVIQSQGAIKQPTLPGQPPPVAQDDPNAKVVSMIMERDRGGPIPSIISGLRFTPFMFTVFNGILFGVLAWSLHTRDERESKIRAAAA